MQVVSQLPVPSFQFTVCRCLALSQVSRVTEETSRVASANLPVCCHCLGMLSEAASPLGRVTRPLVLGFHQDVSSLLLSLDPPGPAPASELAHLLSFQKEHLGPSSLPPSIPRSDRYLRALLWRYFLAREEHQAGSSPRLTAECFGRKKEGTRTRVADRVSQVEMRPRQSWG